MSSLIREEATLTRHRSEAPWLLGEGEATLRLHMVDWSTTALGPLSGWGAPLRTAVNLIMAAPTPMFLFWGRELRWLYNDAARPLVAAPERLGVRGRETRIAGWNEIEPALRRYLDAAPVAAIPVPSWRLSPIPGWRLSPIPGWRLSPISDETAPAGIGGVFVFIEAAGAAVPPADAARLLSESEGRFLSVFNTDLMGLSVFDANTGETLAINRCYLRMTGYDHGVGNEPWPRAATIPPEQAELVVRAVAEARESGWWTPYETVIRRRDGSTFPARVSSAPLPDQPGRVVVAVQDISAERAARAALVASEERLRLGLEAGRMVTWEFDLNARALTRSANSQAIFGGGDRPQDFTSRMPAEDIATDQQHLQRALAAPDGLYQSEFRYNHPDGRQLHLQNWGKIMRDADGKPARVHGVCMDITDRKRAENALKHLNETLEQEVQKRTDALLAAEEALRQSQRMEALGHLTGGVAHDFNNLLGAMVGSFDLIRRRAASPDRVRQLAEAGLKVAERGAKLTGQLLTFSRGQRIELRAVRVADVLHGTHEMLERTLGPLITLAFHLDPEERAVLSDATQLEMAVLNLAINARDAMPNGGTLTIATRQLPLDHDPALPPGNYVELLVQDTGTGMSADVAALAFDPFFTTKEIGKGTGLGLSQVYGIARQAGGTVRIDSAPGCGASIRMLLPCTETASSMTFPPATAPAASPTSTPEILLVDDDVDLREVMAAALDDLGYRVREAADGHAALAMLEQSVPDVLIVDFAMPGMTGAELAKAARARWPDLPIVFASGYADTDAIGQAAGPGNRLLRKPFRIDELQQAITECLVPP